MKRNIPLMYAVGLTQGMVFYGPVATLYRQAQGVTVFEITLIESISMLLCILLEIPWGMVADRIGYKKTMVLSNLIFFASKLIFWQATSFAGFLAERILLSFAVSGLSGVDTNLLYLSCPKPSRQRVLGIYNSLGMAGLLIATVVFTLLPPQQYKLLGLLTAVSYGIAALLSLGLCETAAPESRQITLKQMAGLLGQTLRNRTLLCFLLAVALISETHQTITVFLNQLQYTRSGMTSAGMGYAYIAATALGLASAYSARFTRQAGRKRTGISLFAASLCACLVLAMLPLPFPSIAGILVLRLCDSLFQPFQTEIQNEMLQTPYRATALSLNAMLTNGVAIGTNLAYGALAQYSLSLAFCFGAALCATGLGLYLAWHRRASPKASA